MATTLTETADELCARYRSENGLIGVAADKHDHIILPAGVVDGIQMPQELGDLVREGLRKRDLTTPIVENTGTGYLMFITNGAAPGDKRPVQLFGTEDTGDESVPMSLRVDAGLYRHQAIRTVQGSLITLPGPADEVRLWLDGPDGFVRADFELVARLTIEAGESQSKKVRRHQHG